MILYSAQLQIGLAQSLGLNEFSVDNLPLLKRKFIIQRFWKPEFTLNKTSFKLTAQPWQLFRVSHFFPEPANATKINGLSDDFKQDK